MFAAHGPSHDPSSLVPVVLVAITGLVVFWRTAIKLLAIATILLAAVGFSDLLHAMH